MFVVTTYTNYTNSDYNGFRLNPSAAHSFEWNSPPLEKPADFRNPVVNRSFKTLKELRESTGQEQHSILVDDDTFVHVTMPDMSDPQRLYTPEHLDFRLKPGSAAIDAGIVLPNITDDFTGRAPDLGAYELDRPSPHYGPRASGAGGGSQL